MKLSALFTFAFLIACSCSGGDQVDTNSTDDAATAIDSATQLAEDSSAIDDSATLADTTATADSAAPVDAGALRYKNPVLNQSGDPFAARFGDTYYLYLPDQVRRDGNAVGGRVLAYTSKDLVHWAAKGAVYSNVDDAYGGQQSVGLWAPEVLARDGKYYLYFAQLMSNPKDDRVGDKDIIAIESTDPLNFVGGKKTVLLNDDYAFIDPSPFVDPKTDKLYLLFKRRGVFGTGSEINIRPMSSPTAFSGGPTILAESEKIAGSEQVVEHPEMRKVGPTYFFFFSAGNGARPSYTIRYATGDSPTGPFTHKGILFGSDSPLTGDISKKVIAPGASNIVEDGAGQTWMVYRQKTTVEETFAERAVCIDKIDFAGGKIIASATKGVLLPAPTPL